MLIVVDDAGRRGSVLLTEVTDGVPGAVEEVPAAGLPAAVAAREVDHPRWVWADTARVYPDLLAAGVRVERCHDLRLCRAILRRSAAAAGSALATGPGGPWDEPAAVAVPPRSPAGPSLFDDAPDLFDAVVQDGDPGTARQPADGVARADDPVVEFLAQLDAVAGSTMPGRVRLLLAAESTGALIAAEMHHDGLPWDAAAHDAILTGLLGPRPREGERPARLAELAATVATLLDQPTVSLDSQPHLLAALRRAGLDLTSTRSYEIRAIEHPVVEPLLAYKRLSRLASANGWAWLDTWVHDGRFRPDYVVGGVVTGRWATSGGGALQLPGAIRGAVRADDGWTFVVADARQLEPRVLAAMSGDSAMAAAARGADLYQALVDVGAVDTRAHAKVAMLGAVYGATTGTSGALLPRLARAFPRAMAMVEEAARAGERGEVVSTWLGRSSPRPGEGWQAARAAGIGEGADPGDARAARQRGREWGRFTRNFVVQGTAAEWALCWMAALRRRLREVDGRPHLVFFLHDEVVVHAPMAVAERVADAVRAAAAEAGRLLFGDSRVEFALDVQVVRRYDEAG